jgi:S-adenosylmethionine hydrolase
VTRPITFLSDYGHDDEFAGVCHSVIAWLAPDARVTDISHGVPRQGVLRGALMLQRSLPFAAPGVHLAVVDPGVGTRRRPVVIRTRNEGRLLVGPDNGLLIPAAERFGGAAEAVDITRSQFALDGAGGTFDGRDLFAPVAAKLAAGAALADAGEPFDPGDLRRLKLPLPSLEGQALRCQVLDVDGYGNAATNAIPEDVPGLGPGMSVQVTGAANVRLPYVIAFADVEPGLPLLFTDSSGALAFGVNLGSAAERFRLRPGDEIILRVQ